MDQKTRRLSDQITRRPLPEEPVDESEWETARHFNEEWSMWQDRHNRGEITNAEFNRHWMTMLYFADAKTLGLATRLNRTLMDALKATPSS